MIVRIEQQLKKRFPIGCQVSENNVIQDFIRQVCVTCSLFVINLNIKISKCSFFLFVVQKYPERAIYKVIHTMIRRGELQYRLQRKMLYRVK